MARESQPRFGLRIALWYATLFVVGALAIVLLTYYLAAPSLAQRDDRSSRPSSASTRRRTRAAASPDWPTRCGPSSRPPPSACSCGSRSRLDALVLSNPEGWNPARLETARLRLPDGTLVQVGKSTEARDDLLARFRAALGIVTLTIVAVALTGGWLATQSAVHPIRRLTHAVRRIIRTGRTDQRVPAAGTNDAIDELTVLFNAMLDRIEGLVQAMRGALDNVSHDLRTPLTRLRGTAEMALAGPPDMNRYREALADCVEESGPRAGDAEHADGHLRGRERRDAAAARAGAARGRSSTRASISTRDVAEAKDIDAGSGARRPPGERADRAWATAPGSSRSPPI